MCDNKVFIKGVVQSINWTLEESKTSHNFAVKLDSPTDYRRPTININTQEELAEKCARHLMVGDIISVEGSINFDFYERIYIEADVIRLTDHVDKICPADTI